MRTAPAARGAPRSRGLLRRVGGAAGGLALASCSLLPGDLELPPTVDNGSVAYALQTRKAGRDPREWRHEVTGNVNSNSYIYEPWLATTQANVNVTQDVTRGGTAASDATVFSGTVAANLLPRSKMPTTLSFTRADSRVAGGTLFADDATSNRGMATNHLFLPDDWNVDTNVVYEDTDHADSGRGTVRQASLDVDKNFEGSAMTLGLRHDETNFHTISSGLFSDTTDLATFRHSYSLLDDINVQSSSSLLHTDAVSGDVGRKIFSLQGVSAAQWRPPSLPFTVNGALRTLTQSISLTGPSTLDSDTQLATGTVGVNYPIGPRFTANAGLTGNIQQVKVASGGVSSSAPPGDVNSHTIGALGGLNYYSEPVDLYGFAWTWNASTAAQQLFGSEEGGGQSAAASVGHAVSRPIELLGVSPVVASASQAVRTTYQSTGGAVPGLVHTGSLTYTLSENTAQTYVRLSGDDSRDFGRGAGNELQLITLQLTRQSSIDLSRNWQAALAVQSARQTFDGRDSGFVTSGNGIAAYNEREVFGVRDLTYRSDLTLNALGFGPVIDNRPISSQIYSQWGNRLEYRIGLLIISVENRVFRKEDQWGDLSLFQIRRLFN